MMSPPENFNHYWAICHFTRQGERRKNDITFTKPLLSSGTSLTTPTSGPRLQTQPREVSSLPKVTQQLNSRARIPKMFLFSSLHNTAFPTREAAWQPSGRCCSLGGISHFNVPPADTESLPHAPPPSCLLRSLHFPVLCWIPALSTPRLPIISVLASVIQLVFHLHPPIRTGLPLWLSW